MLAWGMSDSAQRRGAPFSASAQRRGAPFFASAQRSEAPFSDSAQRSEAPFSDSAQRSEAPFSDSAQRSEAPFIDARTVLRAAAAGAGLWAVLLAGCTRVSGPSLPSRKPPVFSDDFNRTELGPAWLATGPAYKLSSGELVVRGAHNHPLWLRRELPRDAVIEFDAWSMDPAGDIKAEVFGDGKSFATDLEYASSGYVFIQGGWHNTITALCRQEEHGHDRKERRDFRVQLGRHYHWLIARHGGQVEWFVDGQEVLYLSDPQPLEGAAHGFLGFDDWETEVHFDNLVVRPY